MTQVEGAFDDVELTAAELVVLQLFRRRRMARDDEELAPPPRNQRIVRDDLAQFGSPGGQFAPAFGLRARLAPDQAVLRDRPAQAFRDERLFDLDLRAIRE